MLGASREEDRYSTWKLIGMERTRQYAGRAAGALVLAALIF